MQDQLEIVKEVISSILKDRKEGKKQLVEWFLNSVMEEEVSRYLLIHTREQQTGRHMETVQGKGH